MLCVDMYPENRSHFRRLISVAVILALGGGAALVEERGYNGRFVNKITGNDSATAHHSGKKAVMAEPKIQPTPAQPTPSSTNLPPMIVLDPGHSGKKMPVHTDSITLLKDHEYPHEPEMTEVFNVAVAVKTALIHDGYRVTMTKDTANDSLYLRDRVNIAKEVAPVLAVSIHNVNLPKF